MGVPQKMKVQKFKVYYESHELLYITFCDPTNNNQLLIHFDQDNLEIPNQCNESLFQFPRTQCGI